MNTSYTCTRKSIVCANLTLTMFTSLMSAQANRVFNERPPHVTVRESRTVKRTKSLRRHRIPVPFAPEHFPRVCPSIARPPAKNVRVRPMKDDTARGRARPGSSSVSQQNRVRGRQKHSRAYTE